MAVRHPKYWPQRAQTAGGVLLVAVLSLALRTFNLLNLPIFLDEVIYLNWAREIWEQRTRAALMIPMAADGKQPLFMWLAGGASYLFSDPLVAGRMLSALAGVASAVGIYLAGYWLAGRRVGLLAGLLYALVPFNLFYDRLAQVEALLNAWGVWTFVLSVFIARKAGGARSAAMAGLGLGVVLGAALWTKMPALFMLPFPVLCALLISRREKLAASLGGFAIGAVVFAALATLLFLMPYAHRMWEIAGAFSQPAESVLTLPVDRWRTNALAYWGWLQTYMPAPLYWLVFPAMAWGLVRRARLTLLLVGCWTGFTLPTMLVATPATYAARYTSQGVFLLLLLLAVSMVPLHDALRTRIELGWTWTVAHRSAGQLVSMVLFLALMGPTLWFDLQLLNAPESAPLLREDRLGYVTDWTAGYGFTDALQLVKQRATELTRDGQPVIVLGYYWWGHTHAGLKLYMGELPGVFLYVDMHLARDPTGFMAAWKSHRVPILIVGNDSPNGDRDRLDQFERGVPQAKRIGFFPKPGGKSSFRVYEIDVADLEP